MPNAKKEWIVQIFDKAPAGMENDSNWYNDWVDTVWTNSYINDQNNGNPLSESSFVQTNTPEFVSKSVANKALKHARSMYPNESYMIVKVKNKS